MVYALGHVSGGHFNPAVTLGLWSAGRFGPARVIPYWIAQVAGAILAAAVLYLVASGKTGFDLAGGFAANGYGAHSPGGYSMLSALVIEIVLTFGFLIVILGATDGRAPAGFAPLAIGRSEEHTSELQSLMRISYAVFCLKTKKIRNRRK